MGILCCKKNKAALSQEIDTEPEISLPSYKSRADSEFSKLEKDYNLFYDVSFNDYASSLVKFSLSNATLTDDYGGTPKTLKKSDDFFKEPFSSDFFQSFIENKIFKHPNVYTKAGSNEKLSNIFKDTFLEVHKALGMKLRQGDKEKEKPEDDNRVKKGHMLALGMIYCGGSNSSKIRVLFDLFEEGGFFSKSEDLEDFLLALFLIPAYCMLSARNKIGKSSDIGELPRDTMKSILDTCELKDSLHLVQVTLDKIFSLGNLNYDTFKQMFGKRDGSIGYLLSAKGIRFELQENNV